MLIVTPWQFNKTLSRLHWEAFSSAAINARRLFVHKYHPLSKPGTYSFTCVNWSDRVNEFAKGFKQQHRVLMRVLSLESDALTFALHIIFTASHDTWHILTQSFCTLCTRIRANTQIYMSSYCTEVQWLEHLTLN